MNYRLKCTSFLFLNNGGNTIIKKSYNIIRCIDSKKDAEIYIYNQ